MPKTAEEVFLKPLKDKNRMLRSVKFTSVVFAS